MSPTHDLHLVIFDCDGVLVDSEVISNEVLARALTTEGLPTTLPEARRDFQGLLLEDIVARAEAKLGRELPDDWLVPLIGPTWSKSQAQRSTRGAWEHGVGALSMPSPEAVIFDNDGLLLDTEEAWTRAERTLFARRRLEFTTEHKRSLIGSSRTTAAVKLESMLELAGEGEALMDELHKLVMEEALAGVEPRPGALELLERLLATGVPVAVASNSQREFVERTLAGAGLLDGRFQAVVSAEDVEHPKPAPDIYLEACRRLRSQPGNCIALEDSPTGVTAAVAAGMYVIGVPYFTGTQLPECDLLADSLADPTVARALGLA